MQFKEAMRLALQSLWANKMRTILTLVGVVIGVASVIAVVTLVNGANGYVATKVYGKGADVFTVSKQPAVITSYEEYVKYQKRKNLNMDDFAAVRDRCKRCQSVGALLNTSGKVVSGTQSSTDTDIRGWSSEMPEMQNLNIAEGRGFTQADEDHAAQVAIIGSDIEDERDGAGGSGGQRDSGGRRGLHGDRAGREAGQDAGAEPG